ncbi:hypothetical protein ACRRTK_012840 [Alexandromys fortis]
MLQTFNLKENHAQSVPPHYQSTILNAFGACASNVPVNIISHLEAAPGLKGDLLLRWAAWSTCKSDALGRVPGEGQWALYTEELVGYGAQEQENSLRSSNARGKLHGPAPVYAVHVLQTLFPPLKVLVRETGGVLGDKGDKIRGVEMEMSLLCNNISLNIAQEPAEKANKALFSYVKLPQKLLRNWVSGDSLHHWLAKGQLQLLPPEVRDFKDLETPDTSINHLVTLPKRFTCTFLYNASPKTAISYGVCHADYASCPASTNSFAGNHATFFGN